jgi:hypothetical protein
MRPLPANAIYDHAVSVVAEHAGALIGLNHGQLHSWGIEHGFNSAVGFAAFKAALLGANINYDRLRSEYQRQRANTLAAQLTQEITLYCDAKARTRRFAVADRHGDAVWYGDFRGDYVPKEQWEAVLDAARKALWVAMKVREEMNCDMIRTFLRTDAFWIQSLSGKAEILAQDARKFNLDLRIEWIPSARNMADKWLLRPGFRKWNECTPSSLVEPFTPSSREL